MTSSPNVWRHQNIFYLTMFLSWQASIVVSFILIGVLIQKSWVCGTLYTYGFYPPPQKKKKKSPGLIGLSIMQASFDHQIGIKLSITEAQLNFIDAYKKRVLYKLHILNIPVPLDCLQSWNKNIVEKVKFEIQNYYLLK